VWRIALAASEWLEFADEADPDHILQPSALPVPAQFGALPGQWEELARLSSAHDIEPARSPLGTSAEEVVQDRDGELRMRFVLARAAAHLLVHKAAAHPVVLEILESQLAAHGTADQHPHLTQTVREFLASLREPMHAALGDSRARALEYIDQVTADGDPACVPPSVWVLADKLPPRVAALWTQTPNLAGLVHHPTSDRVHRALSALLVKRKRDS
jgi:hypothetical protein